MSLVFMVYDLSVVAAVVLNKAVNICLEWIGIGIKRKIIQIAAFGFANSKLANFQNTEMDDVNKICSIGSACDYIACSCYKLYGDWKTVDLSVYLSGRYSGRGNSFAKHT